MRVFLYAHTASGGHLRYTREIADGLANIDVHTVLLTGSRSVNTRAEVEGIVPAPDLSARGWRWLVDRVSTYLRQIVVLRAYARRAQIGEGDVFHFQELPSLLPGVALRVVRATGARTALTVHNVRPHAGGGLASRLVDRWHRRHWRRFDVLVVHSAGLRDELLTRNPKIHPTRVAVVAHAVWQESDVASAVDPKDFVLFGALRRNKGVEVFIDALAALGDPPATIAGMLDESYEAEIRARIAAKALENCDLRPGFVVEEDIPLLLRSHEVVALPYTQFAAQSGVVNQAVACDRPVVVTDVGALGDLVREYGIGEVAASASPTDVAEAMRQCLHRANEGAYRVGLARLRADRSVEAIAREHVSAYLGGVHV